MQIDTSLYLKKDSANPNGEFNASINEIGKICPFTRQFPRGFWSKKLKLSGKSYNDIMYLIQKSGELDEKYSRCGWLANKLSNK